MIKSKLSAVKLNTMLGMQETLNSKITDAWRDDNHNWCAAITGELWECYDHSGWKWWKDTSKGPDIDQMKMEVCDVWHFLLSEMMMYSLPEDGAYITLLTHLVNQVDSASEEMPINHPEGPIGFTRECLLNLIHVATDVDVDGTHIRQLITGFYLLLMSMDMTWDELYKLYIAKNLLNTFRQAHGDKEGTYLRHWIGQEDNQYLTNAINNLDSDSESFVQDVCKALSTGYEVVLAFQAMP